MAFQYEYAVVSQIPRSFEEFLMSPDANVPGKKGGKFNYEEACNEREKFVEALRQNGVDVLEMEADERHPECVKVDDTAVIINGTALMCNPYRCHRQGEVNLIRHTLKKELGIKIVELNTENAQVEGSDVLFTGQEIIVGISAHTNEAGAHAVARAFPEYATSIVKLPQPFRSLKDAVGVAGINVLAVGESEAAKQLLKEIGRVASHTYKVITLPEDHAANVLYINHHLLHLSSQMIPKSIGIFENKINYYRSQIHIPELFNAGIPLSKLALFAGPFGRQKNIISTIP
ncbi:unnamed protein product [Schistosoma margrebowiei]|uniref:Dimethylargininase n=1 Tax=Schistosoma margrebowiei TaxID=48269 RepID=A0AA84ZCV8_9TREM|nr:unnamed protein product [Schistosoma margrebowiei]